MKPNLKCASFWPPTFFQTDQDLGSWFIYEDVFFKFEKLVMECSWNICVTVVPKDRTCDGLNYIYRQPMPTHHPLRCCLLIQKEQKEI